VRAPTTGPWKVDHTPVTGGGKRIFALKDGQKVTVAFTTEVNHDKSGPRNGFIDAEEALANAYRCAASQELYDALTLLMECPDPRHPRFKDAMRICAKAIASADGRR
jgi:hypothetical protein